jgi:hypothetical protein
MCGANIGAHHPTGSVRRGDLPLPVSAGSEKRMFTTADSARVHVVNVQWFRWKEARELSKMAVSCFAMTPRPIPFLMDDPKPATWSVETRLR